MLEYKDEWRGVAFSSCPPGHMEKACTKPVIMDAIVFSKEKRQGVNTAE